MKTINMKKLAFLLLAFFSVVGFAQASAQMRWPASDDDSAAIMAMIADARAAGRNMVVIPKHNQRRGVDEWIIGKTILIPSKMTVVLDGCYLVMADEVFCNMFANENAWSTNRNCAAAEMSDIAIIGRNGAVLDGGNYNCWGEQMTPGIGSHYTAEYTEGRVTRVKRNRLVHNCPIYFHNVKGFRVEGITVRRQRYWGMCYSFCSEGVIRNIRFEADISWVSDDGFVHDPTRRPNVYRNLWLKNGDGIDLRKGCHDILIENISGWSEDDTIALTNLHGNSIDSVEGKCHDICNVTIRNIRTYAWRWMNQVRLLCADGASVHDVVIDGVYDTSDPVKQPWRMASSIQLNDEAAEYIKTRNAVMGDLRNITISNVHSRAGNPIRVFGPIENLNISGIYPKKGAHCAFAAQGSAEFKNCSIEKIRCADDADIKSVIDFFRADGEITVRDIKANEVDHLVKNAGNAKINVSGVNIRNIRGEERIVAKTGSWYNEPEVEPDPDRVDPRFLKSGLPLIEAPYVTPPQRAFCDANGVKVADVVRTVARLPRGSIKPIKCSDKCIEFGAHLQLPNEYNEEWNALAFKARRKGGEWVEAVTDLVHVDPILDGKVPYAKLAEAAGFGKYSGMIEIDSLRLVKGVLYGGGKMTSWHPWIWRWRRTLKARSYDDAIKVDVWREGRLPKPVAAVKAGVVDIEIVLTADTKERRKTAAHLSAELRAALDTEKGIVIVAKASAKKNLKIFLGTETQLSLALAKRVAWFRYSTKGFNASSYVTHDGEAFYFAGRLLEDGSESEIGIRNAMLDFVEANLGTIYPLGDGRGVGRKVGTIEFKWGYNRIVKSAIGDWDYSPNRDYGRLNRAGGVKGTLREIRLSGNGRVPDIMPIRTRCAVIDASMRLSHADSAYSPVNDALYRTAMSWAQLVDEVRVCEKNRGRFHPYSDMMSFDIGAYRQIGVKSFVLETPLSDASAMEIWTSLRMIYFGGGNADALRAYYCDKVYGEGGRYIYQFYAKLRECYYRAGLDAAFEIPERNELVRRVKAAGLAKELTDCLEMAVKHSSSDGLASARRLLTVWQSELN